MRDRDPAALTRLRALDAALRDQQEDRHRAAALRVPAPVLSPSGPPPSPRSSPTGPGFRLR
ncbi:hypothetical protein SRB5_63310 [Streptomyces sp. RB5]|uniref:Uncharacterized protein n=1 Tax=Streptomyces smaragdinus TaxID=2585196 RepID=A0A7K0CRM1_9ACTN|nr:hypothetical protein [Streptomyces smaragdinus]MQY16138.1 hypothetical protein [Streptomyces smaragdinus]